MEPNAKCWVSTRKSSCGYGFMQLKCRVIINVIFIWFYICSLENIFQERMLQTNKREWDRKLKYIIWYGPHSVSLHKLSSSLKLSNPFISQSITPQVFPKGGSLLSQLFLYCNHWKGHNCTTGIISRSFLGFCWIFPWPRLFCPNDI